MARWTVLALVFLSALAWGEAARRGGGGEDVARLQMMMQQLNAEKTAIAAENAKLKKELETSRSEFAKLEADSNKSRERLGATAQDLANARAKGDAVQASFDTLKGRFEELVAQYRKTVETMRALEAERDEFRELASEYDVRVATCERNNDALYKATGELVELYEKKGFMTVLAEREPVTKLKRTRIENMMDEYRQLAEDMRLERDPKSSEAEATGDGSGSTAAVDQEGSKGGGM
jgi:chromosome segregation ATPase